MDKDTVIKHLVTNPTYQEWVEEMLGFYFDDHKGLLQTWIDWFDGKDMDNH